ncbi:MAG: VWA domain-containing protein [Chitinophagaceae bacterium]|nr:MAG: VWA domain-containing protein [Chitinophagaceae bacterium]
MRCYLLLIFLLPVIGLRAQWSGERQGLGPGVNNGQAQTAPLFGLSGDTLYFSESNGSFTEIRYSTRGASNSWMPSQKHELLNPPATGNKTVFTQLCEGQFLVNGHFRQMGRRLYQSKGLALTYTTGAPEYLSLPFSGADTMNNSRYAKAFLFRPAKLLFLSLLRGGHLDLFVCMPLNPEVDDWGRLQWGSPQKLSLNTPYQETAPWLSPDGSTLYFVSDRPGGLGGYDVWYSKRNGDSWTDWSVPKNPGAPVNSKGNESDFRIDPWNGDAIFVSDEGTVGATDIFRVQPAQEPPLAPTPAPAADTTLTAGFDSAHYKLSNIVFLLDLSNSMKQQRRMALLKTAMKPLVAALRPIDKVSLYRFGDHIARLYESPAQSDNRRLLRIVDSLRSQGEATNGSAAIAEGYREALRKLLPGGNNQLFLVTDGDFPVFPDVEKTILSTLNVQLTVVMIDESPEGQRLLQKFRRYPNVQIVTLNDVTRDADALLRSVQVNARR